jgi:dihydropteroate synthase
MGILNVTPDSFSERGAYFDRKAAVARGLEIEREGADILDIGGESTRPGALPVAAEEELDRVIPVIEVLRNRGLRIPISIDTYKSEVAERAIRAGAEIVNDVSGLRRDTMLAQVVARSQAAVVLMHMRGTPLTMQKLPPVRDVLVAVRGGLAEAVRRAVQAGVAKRSIVLDPGLGFGKTAGQNFEILSRLKRVASLGYPVLVGASRKSFIRTTTLAVDAAIGAEALGKNSLKLRAQKPGIRQTTRREEGADHSVPDQLLFGTAAAVTAAILNGAHIVRVHDVRQMVPVLRMADRLLAEL